MAKKVEGYIKLQIPGGKATPAPPVGPALGQHGVNIMQFTKEFNARTADQDGMVIPVVITVYADRSFSFVTKTPQQQFFLRRLVILSLHQVFLTRLRSQQLRDLRFRRLLSLRCRISTQHPLKQLQA